MLWQSLGAPTFHEHREKEIWLITNSASLSVAQCEKCKIMCRRLDVSHVATAHKLLIYTQRQCILMCRSPATLI